MIPKKDRQQGSHPDSIRYFFLLVLLTRGDAMDVEAGLSRLDLARVLLEEDDPLSQRQQHSMNPRRGTTTARLTPIVPARIMPQK